MTEARTESPNVVARRIEDWRRRLIDLSLANRLIAYKPTIATTLEIVAPSLHELLATPDRAEPWNFYLPPEPEEATDDATSDAAATVDELLVRAENRDRPRRANEIEVTEQNPKRIARILDNLAKRSNTEFQDKALRILYVAAGFLDWHDAQRDKSISSPLVLVPVELRRESTRDPYRMFFLEDEEIVINPSLTEKLRRDANLDVPGDWIWEDKPIGQELDEIRHAIDATGWTVRDDAVIGLFSFQKYVMYRDLLDHEDRVARHPIVRSLAHGWLLDEVRDAGLPVPEPSELDSVQEPQDSLSLLDADASQRRCVEAAKRGGSFVMQGPPGTGKSQTIANVIAEAIGQGKRVLFVSEKAAALDVVFKRLAARGLDEYCLMLHGEHAGRREVVQALDHSLTTSLQPRPVMRADEMERLVNLRIVLNDSAELLHLPQPALGGRTLRQVHEQLAQLYAAPSMPGAAEPDALAGTDVLDEFQSLSAIFQRLADRWYVSPPDYLWRGYDDERFTADDHGRVLAAVRQLSEATRGLLEEAARAASRHELAPAQSLSDARRLADVGGHLECAPALEPDWLDLGPAQLTDAVDRAEAAYADLAGRAAEFKETFPARGVGDFPADAYVRLRDAAQEVQRTCGWASAWDTQLSALPDAVRALDELPGLVVAMRERAATATRLLGQPEDWLSRARLEGVAELAEIAFNAERRPERDWLVRAGLERAERAHADLADDLAAYQAQRARIFEHYHDSALELDAAAIGRRFAEQSTSLLSKLSGSYRQDAKAVKATRKDGKLPATLDDDLKLIAGARELGHRIDAKSERAAQALGSYAAGRDTDPAAVAEALAVARRVLELSAADADLDVLAGKVTVGSSADPSLARAADQLRAATQALVDRLAALQLFVATPTPLFADDADQLEAAVTRADLPIRRLAALIAALDTGAARPVDTIAAARQRAEMIAALHSAQERVAVDSEMWKRTIGSPFEAGDTDWSAPRSAAAWLERSRCLRRARPERGHAPRARVRSARLADDRRCRPGLRPDARGPRCFHRPLRKRPPAGAQRAGRRAAAFGDRRAVRHAGSTRRRAARLDGMARVARARVRARLERLRHRAHHRAGRRDAGARLLPARLLEPPARGPVRRRAGARRGPQGRCLPALGRRVLRA